MAVRREPERLRDVSETARIASARHESPLKQHAPLGRHTPSSADRRQIVEVRAGRDAASWRAANATYAATVARRSALHIWSQTEHRHDPPAFSAASVILSSGVWHSGQMAAPTAGSVAVCVGMVIVVMMILRTLIEAFGPS